MLGLAEELAYTKAAGAYFSPSDFLRVDAGVDLDELRVQLQRSLRRGLSARPDFIRDADLQVTE